MDVPTWFWWGLLGVLAVVGGSGPTLFIGYLERRDRRRDSQRDHLQRMADMRREHDERMDAIRRRR